MSSKICQKTLALVKSSPIYGIQKASGHAMQILLTPLETRICGVLNQVTEYVASKQPHVPKIELRIAGGWVRDKLLGLESHDLDFATSQVMGYQFAQYVNEYLALQGQPVKTIAKISSNPDRSKHLETATTQIYGVAVDFVNLRSETYSKDSRIPEQVTFGTPNEDAYRRDCTINALFYNIQTNLVEDHTSQGLRDLQDGIIRTPLPPLETFLDDPLRVLRVLRFATRFHFEIEKETLEALSNPLVKKALDSKVSKERVGVELMKIFQGGDAARALKILYHTDLMDVVIGKKPEQSYEIFSDNVEIAYRIKKILSSSFEWQEIFPSFSMDKAWIPHLYLAAAYNHLKGHVHKQKTKVIPLSNLMIREKLKLSTMDAERAASLIENAESINSLVSSTDTLWDRLSLGRFIRNLSNEPSVGKDWHLGFVYASVATSVSTNVNAFKQIFDRIKELDLEQVHSLKSILDGKKVAEVLKLRMGPDVKKGLDLVMDWQLANPQGTAEECRYWLSQQSIY